MAESSDKSRKSEPQTQDAITQNWIADKSNRIKTAEERLQEVRETVYGPNKRPDLGLEKSVEDLKKRVRELEEGFWTRVLRWFKFLVVFLFGTGILAAIDNALDLWERLFSSGGKS